MMTIMDMNGKPIEVSDLDLAILQADDFRHYQLDGMEHIAFNNRQQEYWNDVYQKLMEIRGSD